jgi:excisionase family DNA binding protein
MTRMDDQSIALIPTNDFMTVPEVAKYLRVSPTSVYRLVERRDMPFYRTGGKKILFKASDVENYLAKCRIAPFDEPVPRRKPNPVR